MMMNSDLDLTAVRMKMRTPGSPFSSLPETDVLSGHDNHVARESVSLSVNRNLLHPAVTGLQTSS